MSSEKENIEQDSPIDKLFEAMDENGLSENVNIKSIELAIKRVEMDLKYIRRALKGYRKNSEQTSTILKG